MVLSLERLTHPSSKNTEQQVFEAPTKTQSNLWSYREILPALLWHGNQGEATTRRLASPCAPGWPPRRANAGSWKRMLREKCLRTRQQGGTNRLPTLNDLLG